MDVQFKTDQRSPRSGSRVSHCSEIGSHAKMSIETDICFSLKYVLLVTLTVVESALPPSVAPELSVEMCWTAQQALFVNSYYFNIHKLHVLFPAIPCVEHIFLNISFYSKMMKTYM